MKILRLLNDHLEAVICSVLLFLMSVLVIIQVFMRYVMRASLSWSEELARYCMVWLVYVGVSFAVRRSAHIRVDVINLVLPNWGKKLVAVFANLMFFAFAVIITSIGYRYVGRLFRLEQTSPGMEIPMAWVYLAVPTGLGLSAIRLVQSTYNIFRGGGTPKDRQEEAAAMLAEQEVTA